MKTLRLRSEIEGEAVERGQAFRKLGPLVHLRPPHDTAPEDAWLRQHRTKLNWLPRIRGLAGETRTATNGTQATVSSAIGQVSDLPRQTLKTIPSFMFDVDALLFGMEAFKASRGLDRLHVDGRAIRDMLARDDWYELMATADDMRLDRYENRAQWQRMAQQLLNAYAERYYRYIRGRWEAPYLEVTDLAPDDPNLVDGYTVETTELAQTADQIEEIASFVENLKAAIGKNALAVWSQWGGRWRTVPFGGHLYQPLLHVGKNAEIRISPVALDKWEAEFVHDLATWCTANRGREVYLLRNQAVTGLGFFQASNFFPDFLLWVQDGERQHLAFVDPKGLHHFDPSDPKVQFATRDVPRLQQIISRQTPDLQTRLSPNEIEQVVHELRINLEPPAIEPVEIADDPAREESDAQATPVTRECDLFAVAKEAILNHQGVIPLGEYQQRQGRPALWPFVPASWQMPLPPLRKGGRESERSWWLAMWLDSVRTTNFGLSLLLSPMSNQPLRMRIVDRLLRDPDEFGILREDLINVPGIPTQWVFLAHHVIAPLSGHGLDTVTARQRIEAAIDKYVARFDSIGKAIEPLLGET